MPDLGASVVRGANARNGSTYLFCGGLWLVRYERVGFGSWHDFENVVDVDKWDWRVFEMPVGMIDEIEDGVGLCEVMIGVYEDAIERRDV